MITYTEKQILELMGTPNAKRLGQERLIKFCKSAGLIIEPIPETLQGKGKTIQYKILTNHLTLENEKWIPCIYSDDYEVSNLGRVRKIITKRLVGFKDDKGYMKASLNNRQIGVQRLVYFSFHPEDFHNELIFTIDHINGIRTDNRIENLRPLSIVENDKQMRQNQDKIQSIAAQLISKYGYEETQKKLLSLL